MRTIRDCNVAVVGGAGFLGSHLVNHLIEDRGCRVLVIDNLESGRREFVHPKARFFHHDITGSEQVLLHLFYNELEHCQPVDYVFNYAARPYVPDSYSRPLRTSDVNFIGALKVINAAQEAGVKGILQVSSAEVYGGGKEEYAGRENMWGEMRKLTEHTECTPHSSYGVSKMAVDAECQVRWREARTPVIALRQFNCVGERETHPYVVPEIISQLANQQVFNGAKWEPSQEHYSKQLPGAVKLGNNSFRDFLYAGDAVRIAVELLERGQFGEVYNLGSESGVKVYDLAKLIGKVMRFSDVRVEKDESRVRPWEIWHLQSDNTKIMQTLLDETHFHKPRSEYTLENLTPLEEALRRTVKWYESNGRKWPWE